MKKIIILLSLCLVTRLLIVARGVAYGGEMTVLEEKIEELKKANQNLELEIAQSASFVTIAQKAIQDGFVSVAGRVENNSSVALKR